MPRTQTEPRRITSISFEPIVAHKLDEYCKKHGVNKSAFVNSAVKKKVIHEEAFLLEKKRYHIIEANKIDGELMLISGAKR